MLADGRGGSRDWQRAALLFHALADGKRGIRRSRLLAARAAYRLALQLAHGRGVPTDYLAAEVYFGRALAGASPAAAAGGDDGDDDAGDGDGGDERLAVAAGAALADLRRLNMVVDNTQAAALRQLAAAGDLRARHTAEAAWEEEVRAAGFALPPHSATTGGTT